MIDTYRKIKRIVKALIILMFLSIGGIFIIGLLLGIANTMP